MPEATRERLKELNSPRITKLGEIIFTSDKTRTQEGNLKGTYLVRFSLNLFRLYVETRGSNRGGQYTCEGKNSNRTARVC